jgi:hypothetical protein
MDWGTDDPVVSGGLAVPDVVSTPTPLADATVLDPYASRPMPEAEGAAPGSGTISPGSVGGPLIYDPKDPGPMSKDGVPFLALAQRLERSGVSAVSPKGAIGTFQIMPATARLYGADPARLTDAAYNRAVARQILTDLSQKTGGDLDATLVQYNASSKVYQRWLASGRDNSVLPTETQHYLALGHAIVAKSHPQASAPASLTSPWEVGAPVGGQASVAPWEVGAPVAGAPAPVAPWEVGAPVATDQHGASRLKPVTRFIESAFGGAVEGLAPIIKGAGQFADAALQGTFASQAGQAEGVSPQMHAQLAQQGRTHQTAMSAQVTPVAQVVAEKGQSITPTDLSGAEKVAHAAGGFAPLIVTGPAGFAASAYNEAFDGAIAKGQTPDQAQNAALQNGAVQAAIGALPLGEAAKLAGAIKSRALKFAAETGIHAGAGGAFNAASTFASNVNAKMNFDPDRGLFDGVPEAFGVGVVAGGTMHAAGTGTRAAVGAAYRAVKERLRPAETPPVDVSTMPSIDAVAQYAGPAWAASDPVVGSAPAGAGTAGFPPLGSRRVLQMENDSEGRSSFDPVTVVGHHADYNTVTVEGSNGVHLTVPVWRLGDLPGPKPDSPSHAGDGDGGGGNPTTPRDRFRASLASTGKATAPDGTTWTVDARPSGGFDIRSDAGAAVGFGKRMTTDKALDHAATMAFAAAPEGAPALAAADSEVARLTEGVPPEAVTGALADINELRAAAPKGSGIFQAIKGLGGMRLKGADGERYPAGPDIESALQDVTNKPPGMINNKTGMTPEQMHEALADGGWFTGDDATDSNALTEALRQEGSGSKFYHPDDQTPHMLYRRDLLERDVAEAGVDPKDPPVLAAAKLAAYRHAEMTNGSIAMETLRGKADALGIEHDQATAHDQLLHDVVEREAIQQEASHAGDTEHERAIDGQLTHEDIERLHALAREGPEHEHGAGGAAFPLPEGWESEPPASEGYSEPIEGPGHHNHEPARSVEDARAQLATIKPSSSWVVVDRETGKPVLETFERKTAERVNQSRYEVLTAQDWLERFNGSLRKDVPEPTTEAVRLHGETVDQGVMPGMEQSAHQAALAREGGMRSTATQAEPGGLFAPPEPEQHGLFGVRLPKFEDEIAYHQGRQEEHQRAVESLDTQIGKPFTGGEEISSLRAKVKGLEAEIEASSAGAKTTGAPALAQEPGDDGVKFQRDSSERPDLGAPRLHETISATPAMARTLAERKLISQVADEVRRIAPFAETHAYSHIEETSGEKPETVFGMSYRDGLRRIVSWSLEASDHIGTARHEAIHALKSAGVFHPEEWESLVKGALAEDWMGRYNIEKRYPDLTPEQKMEEAIAERFSNWNREKSDGAPTFLNDAFNRIKSVLAKVADMARKAFGADATPEDVLSRVQSGEVGARPLGGDREGLRMARGPADADEGRSIAEIRTGPRGVINRLLGHGAESVGRQLQAKAERAIPDPVASILDDVKMGVSPMGMGSERAQAEAKDFANATRKSAYQWGRMDEWLTKNFTPEDRKAMWEAADEHGVILRRGETPGEGEGLNRLTPAQRETVLGLQSKADEAFAQAKKLGMVQGDGLESYVPRMVIQMTVSGPQVVKSATPAQAKRGGNLSTTTGQLRQRKYETVEETDAAAKRAFGDKAMVVRDIRTLGLGTQRLEQAIAGRTLVEKIKAMSKDAGGGDLVVEGANPNESAYFTIEHPALKTWGPKMVKNDETGVFEPVKDQNGGLVFEARPLYISKEFEGPLKAVLSGPSSGLVRAAMDLKGKMMSVIMYSPMMHNAVIWGKAIPADPMGVLTFRAYARGNAVRKNPELMGEAISAGMDPIGHRYFNQDIAGIAAAEGQDIVPGRSWTSQVVAAIPGLYSREAGDATKRAIDKMGDVWHNTFLWDRVADLQAGLYVHMRDGGIAKGMDPQTAQRMAAHYANRYAGAIPMEAMSKGARTMANLLLFSRSFTLGNLGAFKDLTLGLPSDVRAQIMRDKGLQALEQVQGVARQKAAALLVIDVALQKLGLVLAASAAAWLTGQALQMPWDNEPGKENRFLIGYQPDGTAIYGRLPTGKVAEDLQDWITEPRETLLRKQSNYSRLAYEMASNDKGFGQKLYDPHDHSPAGFAKNVGRVVWNFVGGILPEAQLQAMEDVVTGRTDRKTAALQSVAPLTGLTISKGAPGGPAMADLYAAKDEQSFKVAEARPQITALIKSGDVTGARAKMTELGITPPAQSYMIRAVMNPQARMSGRAIRDFLATATPEQRVRFEADRAGQVERAANGP